VGADDERAGEGGGGNEDREREQYKEKCEAFLHSSDYIRVSAAGLCTCGNVARPHSARELDTKNLIHCVVNASSTYIGAARHVGTDLVLERQADPEQAIGSDEPRHGEPWIFSKRYYTETERRQCCTN
jgi:hypothetical protein